MEKEHNIFCNPYIQNSRFIMNRNNVGSFSNAYIMTYYAQAVSELGHDPPDKRLKPLENVKD